MTEPKNNASLPQVRRPLDLLNQLLERKDVATYIPKIPAQEMYFTLREIGISESVDLLRYCSPEQIQAFFDLDSWRKDHLISERVVPWLQALMELGPTKIGQVFEELDHEFAVSLLKQEIRVYDLSMEEAPEDSEGHFYMTPDRFYVVDVLSAEHGPLIERLIESLYAKDIDLGRRIMMGVKWDTGPETDEAAYRFHVARMSDMGYVEQYEALDIYQIIDPSSVRVGEGSGPDFTDPLTRAPNRAFLPQEWVDSIRTDRLFFSHTLKKLALSEQNVVLRYLLFLLNRALAAEMTDLADSEKVKPIIESTLGYLSLGLEYIARPLMAVTEPAESHRVVLTSPEDQKRERLQRSALALRTVSLKRLFQVGYSLAAQLAKLGRILSIRGLTTLTRKQDPASLLESPHGEVLRLLLEEPRRPMYNAELDGAKMSGRRPFRTLEDIQNTAVRLEEIGSLGQFLTIGLGLRVEKLEEVLSACQRPISDVQLVDILGTMMSNFILGRPPSMVLLERNDLLVLREEALSPSSPPAKLRPAVQKKILEMLHIRVKERSLHEQEEKSLWSGAVQEFVERTLGRLAETLAMVPEGKKALSSKQLGLLSAVLVKR